MAAQLFLLLAVFNYLKEANRPVRDVSVQLCWSHRSPLPSHGHITILRGSPFKFLCLSVESFPQGSRLADVYTSGLQCVLCEFCTSTVILDRRVSFFLTVGGWGRSFFLCIDKLFKTDWGVCLWTKHLHILGNVHFMSDYDDENCSQKEHLHQSY